MSKTAKRPGSFGVLTEFARDVRQKKVAEQTDITSYPSTSFGSTLRKTGSPAIQERA